MAKSKKAPPTAQRHEPKGPFLSAALIVEQVLTEKDGVSSLIRCIDRIGITAEDAEKAKSQSTLNLPLTMAIAFRAGDFVGKSILLIVQAGPSGETCPVGAAEMQFGNPHASNVNVFSRVMVQWDGPGQYWFDVTFDNKFATRIGLHVDAEAPVGEKDAK